MKGKTLVLSLLIAAMVFTPAMALAEDDLPVSVEDTQTVELDDPGMLPDSPFYVLKTFGENLQLMVTFNERAKLSLKVKFAERRLAEAEAVAGLNKTQLVEPLMLRYRERVQEIEQGLDDMEPADIAELQEYVDEKFSRHIEVLTRVYEKVPDEAKSGIRNALENTETSQGRLWERVQNRISNQSQFGNATGTGSQNQEINQGQDSGMNSNQNASVVQTGKNN